MSVINWDIKGYFKGENFTKPGGVFFTKMQALTTQTAVDWLHEVAPEIRDEAKDLAPYITGEMRDSIYARYNDAEMYAEIGSDLPASGGRTYIIFQELGYEQNGVNYPGKHFLARALTNVTSKM